MHIYSQCVGPGAFAQADQLTAEAAKAWADLHNPIAIANHPEAVERGLLRRARRTCGGAYCRRHDSRNSLAQHKSQQRAHDGVRFQPAPYMFLEGKTQDHTNHLKLHFEKDPEQADKFRSAQINRQRITKPTSCRVLWQMRSIRHFFILLLQVFNSFPSVIFSPSLCPARCKKILVAKLKHQSRKKQNE
jgi:hypothetical protein